MLRFFRRVTTFIFLFVFVLDVSASEIGFVTCDVLNVRESPNTDCAIVDRMPYGTEFEIIYTDNGWYNIKMNNGITGFVSAAYVNKAQKSPADLFYNGVKTGAEIAKLAHNYIGSRYSYGSSGPNTFDCSGFTSYLYKQYGYSLPRTSTSQSQIGVQVGKDGLVPGDILCFSNRRDRKVNHVGIYVGESKFIHASTSVRGVVMDDLNSDYFSKNYVCARRIL